MTNARECVRGKGGKSSEEGEFNNDNNDDNDDEQIHVYNSNNLTLCFGC